MAWAFDVTSNIPRITQSGTDTGLGGIATAISGVAAVARSTAYTTTVMRKPPADNGMWYRCSTAGTTATTAPTYNPVAGSTTTDGTAVFTAFQAPLVQTLGTTNFYYMPAVRVQILGALTNENPQQQSFLALDVFLFGGSANFISGAWASDGVTPLWDGVHFATTRTSTSGADPSAFFLQSGSQCTLIGGEVQVSGGVSFDNGTTPRSYLTRWRNTKEFGASSARYRSYTTNVIFQNIEAYDMAFDLFRMPTVAPSIKARGSEYVYQYVGAQAGGADAKFVASNLENPNGTYDFDNYFSGWVELYNCKAGAALKVVSQYPNAAFWVRHCVPLYQDIAITAKDTTGIAVQDVRFTATETPTNSPTITITTVSNLKTWDFRTPLSYQTTTNSSGVATSSPVLNVWYYQSGFKQSLRFPSSTATYQGRAYNYKTLDVSAVLGSETAIPVSAGMIGLDTATTITEAASLALTGITLTPSGATGGSIVISSNQTLQDIWNYYRAWISQFANRASNDTWTCIGGLLDSKAWSLTVSTGVTITGDSNINSYKTTGTVTLNGSAQITAIYTSSAGTSAILQLVGVSNNGVVAVWNPSTLATELFQTNVSGSSATYTVYYPPSATGSVKNYARELYGFQRVAGSITLAAGLNTISFVNIPDVGITETNQATVLAYTAIENPDKRYDRTAAFRLSEQGIKLGQIATRAGTSIEGTVSVVVKDDAASVYSILGNVLTIKSASYSAGVKFDTEIVLGGGTFTAFDTEVITIPIEDGNGNSSITIVGGRGTYEIWKITTATTSANYATGTKVGDFTTANNLYRFIGDATSGFDYLTVDTITTVKDRYPATKGVYTHALYSGAEIQLAEAPQVIENGVKLDVLKNEIEAIKGAAFSTATDSLKAISDSIDALPVGATLEAIEGSTIIAKEASIVALGSPMQADDYVAPDNASITAIKAKTDKMDFNAQNHLAANVHQLQAGAITSIQNGLAIETTSQAIKTKVDTLSNYNDATAQTKLDAIKAKTDTLVNTDVSGLATQASVTALGSPLQASAYVAPDNTKIGQIKTKVDTLVNYNDATAQTKLDAIKAKTDTLINTDVSSLATQASVDALGDPLQADDYVAPANSDIAAIKAKTDTLVNTDLTDVEADLAKIQKNTKLIPATL